MKKLTLIAIAFLMIGAVACKKEKSTKLEMPKASDTAGYFRYSEYNFISSAHSTTGSLIVFGNDERNPDTLMYYFKNFKTDSGPDLDVYISQELNPVNFTNIGDLKAFEGTFFYKIKNTPTISTSDFVIVWCVQANVNFGYADID